MVVAAGVGIVVAVGVAWFVPWQLTVLAGWDATAATLLVWVWLSVGRLNSQQTAAVATAEDNTRQGTRLLLVGAAIGAWSGLGWP